MVQIISKDTDYFKMGDSYIPQLVYILLLPLFFMVFSLFYNPFDIQGYYSSARFGDSFHLLMLACIILGVLAISRTMLHFILKAVRMPQAYYVAWCLLEMFVMSLFMALYTVLMKERGHNYFQELSTCMKYCFTILCYPYMVMTLARIVMNKSAELRFKAEQEDNSLVRFYDEHHRLKLTIAPSSILYVKSDYNYIKINYMDAGKVKEFVLRASMKSLENPSFSHCLVRCQRSYFVNPEHVTVLRKDSDGFIYAEMNIPDVPAVPVSKQYYGALSELL